MTACVPRRNAPHSGQFPQRLHLAIIPQPRRSGWRRWGKRRRRFELLDPFKYITSDWVTVSVPAGTIVDGASVPCFFWRLVGQPWGEYAEATVIHDYLWKLEIDRMRRGNSPDFRWANIVFLDAMTTLGVARWRRRIMWAAVALNGWLVARQYRTGRK